MSDKEKRQCALNQHIGWLKIYVECMTERNWRDMRLRIERQMDMLVEEIKGA